MDTRLENGDFSPDARNLPRTVSGVEELAQRAMIRLCVPRGAFWPDPTLGSDLRLLPRLAPQELEPLAGTAVREALAPLPQVGLEGVRCAWQGDSLVVGVSLRIGQETRSMEVTI